VRDKTVEISVLKQTIATMVYVGVNVMVG